MTAMRDSDLGLSVGMSLDAVRRLLAGWKDHPVRAADTLDQTHYFSIWDFVPPEGSGQKTIRMTFDGTQLVFWGEPSSER